MKHTHRMVVVVLAVFGLLSGGVAVAQEDGPVDDEYLQTLEQATAECAAAGGELTEIGMNVWHCALDDLGDCAAAGPDFAVADGHCGWNPDGATASVESGQVQAPVDAAAGEQPSAQPAEAQPGQPRYTG